MNAAHLARIETIFRHAVALPPEARAAYLSAECETDPDLLRDVHALLAADAQATASDFLDTPPLLDRLLEDEGTAPEHLGPYRLVRLLGRGGMGRVYLAERDDVQKRVAVKRLHAALDTPDAVRRFRLEQTVLARLDHPHIARFLDAGIGPGGVPYFAMEYVDGEPLLEHARRLPIADRIALFDEICAASAYAHQHLVVHRDLKPSNVLVDRGGRVKLLDFGIAKLLEDDDDALTRDGLRMMTPDYATPEQVRGEPVTPATDVYALGLMLFELLTDSRPYSVRDATPAQAERIVCEAVPPRPSTLVAPDLMPRDAADLDAICLQALEKDPERRYPTAAELRADVQHYLAQQPVDARAPTRTYLARKFIARHRVAVATAASLAILLLTGSALVFWQAQRATRERARADEERLRAEQARRESASVTDLLLGLFEAGHPADTPGVDLTARELVERGRVRAERLDAQPLVQARMFDTIGRVYQGLGDLGRAEPLLRRALDLRRTRLGDDHVDVAASRHHLAALLQDKGVYPEAETHYQAALALRRRLLGPDHPDLAATLGRYGLLVLRMRRDDRTAETYIREAVDISVRTFGDGDPQVASMLNLLAGVYDFRRDYAASERLLREALRIQRERLGPLHPDTVTTLNNLGTTLADLGNLEAAQTTLTEALELNRQVLGEVHAAVASNLNNLASVHERRQQLARAETLYRQAASTAEAALGADHPTAAWLTGNLARVLASRGRTEEAEALYTSALKRLQARLGADHPNARAVAQRLADLRKART